MEKYSKIVIIGAGVFGLSVARQLAAEGFHNILVLDRHVPPVPDGSSTDISRVVRFDYADKDYVDMAHEAYLRWRDSPKYKGIYFPARFILAKSQGPDDRPWTERTMEQVAKKGVAVKPLEDASAVRRQFSVLTGEMAPNFFGYCHEEAGWTDASKAIQQLCNECLALGVSMLCGPGGTVTDLETGPGGTIKAVRTASGDIVPGQHFILSAGAWTSGLVPMYNSSISTAQIIGYTPLSLDEVQKYRDVPIYCNSSTGWFNFPSHSGENTLKMAVHGWGYTREPSAEETKRGKPLVSSSPPLAHRLGRANFVPADGEKRLREGLREILPELADRPFEKVALCWYTDTPTGDFVMDYHPDHANLFIAGGGSGHGFKFLPVLGEYLSKAMQKKLPKHLAYKWRFRTEYKDRSDMFLGDGSRGGPARRELTRLEKEVLEGSERAKL